MTNPLGVIGIAVGGLALMVAVAVFVSFSSVRRRLLILQGRAGQADILEATSRQVEEVRALRGEIRNLAEHVSSLGEALQGALQRFAVHRYDAFEDMGGKLSFSAAFLDVRGNGIIVTCINGRQEARTYAKPVEQGRSAFNLSPEEQEAIRQAFAQQVSR
jgi:uncharacterized protein YlxW (UPF0749 family)